MHETTGPCEPMHDVINMIGMVSCFDFFIHSYNYSSEYNVIFTCQNLPRRKYLCVTDYDEKYFDFHCTPTGKPPGHYYDWYTICGTPFENRVEYISVIAAVGFLAFNVFFQCFFKSGPPIVPGKSAKDGTKQKLF